MLEKALFIKVLFIRFIYVLLDLLDLYMWY